MALSRARPIDRLYEDVGDDDLVIVPDAPLASALNRRLDRAHFGPFATTPGRLAAGRRESTEERTAFLRVIEGTDLGWKDASYAVGNVLQCWRREGRRDAILSYDGFDDRPTRTVVSVLDGMDTRSARLADHSIDDDRSVAVVGIDRLTALERSILPGEYDVVDPLTDGAFDPPPFRIFDSPAAIVDALMDTITAENADDVGVVLDRGSRYSPLVESALEANDVPFYGGPGFADDPHHRAFLAALRVAHAGTDVRVADVRPLCARLGVEVDVTHAGKRLDDVGDPAVEWVVEFRDSVDSHTFDSALDAYEAAAGTELSAFRDELATLGLGDQRVTESAVDRLAFYLDAYEVPVDRGGEGVLLADAEAAAYVDRPLVFYLGLDESWTHAASRRPWIDPEREFERNRRQFQLLLQNGREQYYLVQDTEGGSPVTPCLYFESLLDGSCERFDDLDSVPHTRTVRPSGDGFEREPVDVDPEPVGTISQSSLNTYVNCPRDYYFDRILDDPDADYLVEGNLFHDFAEFYATHPDAVDDDAVEEVVDLMLDEVRPFVREAERSLRRTKYRVGLETIVEFLDANPPAGDDLTTPTWSPGNAVADHFGKSVDSPATERWFENGEVGIRGLIDLVHGPTHLLDYKSGSKKSAHRVVWDSSTDPPAEGPNFQALLYLAHLRTERPGERLEFTFFHFLEALDDVLTGEASLDDCLTTITYYPVALESHLASREVFDELVADGPNDCRKTLSGVEYDDYRAAVERHPFPDTRDVDELAGSDLGRALIGRMRELVGDYAYVGTGCRQALRHLRDVRDRNYFAGDLDAFEAFVDERLGELDRRRAGEERFPVEDFGTEPNYRYVDNRDLLLGADD